MKNKIQNLLTNAKHDLPASIVVFFVALPLCLGIALASGAPLFSGIIAGIVGGIVVGALSGSQIGVSGPAAGLSVVVLGYIASLGNSWEAFLLAVVLAGLLQVIAGFMKMGNIARYFPESVVKGMLSGIGIIIILKQIPHAIGYNAEFKDDFDFDTLDAANTSSSLMHMLEHITPNAVIIAVISMFLLVFWNKFFDKKLKFLKAIPAPLVAVVAGITLSNFLHLEETQIVTIPLFSSLGEFLGNFTTPDFSQIYNKEIYGIALVIAVIASLETLLCVEATDKLDPQKRVTPGNRELKAQGVGNIISGLIGGLPITQVVARSSANIEFGAKTKLSAIIHGFLLLICVILVPNLLNMIPLATLACVLLLVGYKLAKPEIFAEVYKSGHENFLPFVTTILGMLAFDLLKGVGIGMMVATFFILRHNYHNKKLTLIPADEDDQAITMTREIRDSITPKQAIQRLKEGNERFINNLKLNRNLLQQINETSEAQHPFAFVLSCIDSRTSAELIFDQGLGDIFSCRIAGNILNDDIVGSMEFACKVAEVKLIMVLGHSACGAIKGACDQVEMGKLTGLLKKIKPSVRSVKGNPKDEEFVEKVAALNVEYVTSQITKESRIIHDLHKKGKVAIISGMYNVSTGKVEFYNI